MALFRRKRRGPTISFHIPEHEYRFDIVGESFYKDHVEALVRAGWKWVQHDNGWDKIGVQCWLVPDPTNPHDANAVGVWAGHSKGFSPDQAIQIGFAPKDTARWMSPRLPEPLPVDGVILGKKGNWGVKLDWAAMEDAGIAAWRTWIDDVSKEFRNRKRKFTYKGQLRHRPDHPAGPNTVTVVLRDRRTIGVVRPTEKLWGPNVDGTEVEVTVFRHDEAATLVQGVLPSNASEPTGWKCGDHCAAVSRIDDGRYQATGRLAHLRFKIPTCDKAREGFREAKRKNTDES